MNEVDTELPDVVHHLEDVKQAVRRDPYRDHEHQQHVCDERLAMVVKEPVSFILAMILLFSCSPPIT